MPEASSKAVPTWILALGLVGLLALAAAGGYSLSEYRHRGDESRIAELNSIEAWRAKTASETAGASARLGLANELELSGRPLSALETYDRVLKDNPHDIAALYGRGLVTLKLNRPTEAEAAFWAVLAEDKTHVLAAEALGDFYAAKQQYRSLIRAVQPAVTAHPAEARLQYLMGLAYEHLGHLDWAAARFRLALEANPSLPEAREGLKRLEPSP